MDEPFYPVAYCKDLSDSLVDVLERESAGYRAGRAVYDFFLEFTSTYHRFAVDLAKAAKAAQSALGSLNHDKHGEAGGSFLRVCAGLPPIMMQLAQAHSAIAQQVSQHTLAPLQKYEEAARPRLSARREEVVRLTAALEQEKKVIEGKQAFAQQTLVKLAKTNMQKDKKVWLRRRNKSIERLEDYKAALVTANCVATNLRMNEVANVLLQMQEEEEQRTTQIKVSLSSFAYIVGRGETENSVESIPKIAHRLSVLVEGLDPLSDLTQFVHHIGVAEKKHSIAMKISDLLAQASARCERDELVSLSGSLARATTTQEPTPKNGKGNLSPTSPTAMIAADTAKVVKLINAAPTNSRLDPQATIAKRKLSSSAPKDVETEMPPIVFDYPYEISTPKDLWGAVSERSTKQAGMFFSSLEGVMEHQERCFPSLHKLHHDSPIILDILVKATGRFGAGLQTKRLCWPIVPSGSPSIEERLLAMQVQTLQEQYESGNFRFTMTSALVPGTLLQHWLMGLAEPLIPYNSYSEAISLIRDSSSPREVIDRMCVLLSKLPLIHWRVLDRVDRKSVV